MGAAVSLFRPFVGGSPSNLIMVGLEGSGKNAIIDQLNLGHITVPNGDSVIHTVDIGNMTLSAWDLHGERINANQIHHVRNLKGLIFVVDSTDSARFIEVKDEMDRFLGEAEVPNVPLLVLANKQDLPNAASVPEVLAELVLNGLDRTWHIEGSSTVSGSGTGKTSLVFRFTKKTFPSHVRPTLGAEYNEITQEIGDYKVKLQIWDTAGQERFKSLIPMYYRNAHAALMVYDVTDEASFQALKHWISELQQHDIEGRIVKFLVGNKCDHVERKILQSEVEAFSNLIGAHFREVSALSNQGINEMFMDISIKLIHTLQQARNRSMTSQSASMSRNKYLFDSHANKENGFKCCT